MPLHLKIVVASAVCSGLAFGLGMTGAGLAGRSELEMDPIVLALGLGLAWMVVAALVSAGLVRVALGPLRHVEEVAARIEGGELDARASLSRLADRDIARLVRAFNQALDKEAAFRGRLRELARQSLRSEEASSRRIAVELREGPGQRLAALLLRLPVAERGAGGPTLGEMVEEARGEIAAALDIVGRHTGDRAERLLDDLGLKGAIAWQARQSARKYGLDVSVHVGVVDAVLPRAARIALLLVVQEALENVGRHARARSAVVRVGCTTRDRIVAEIIDDGRGFDPRLTIADGVGLLRLEERMAALGGRLHVASTPSHGTRITGEIPLRTQMPIGSGADTEGAA